MDIKSKIGAFISRLCTMILALLGYNCSSFNEPNEPYEMYGTPTGTFEVKGAVTNEEGHPVADAEIRVTDKWHDSWLYSIQSVTDKEGTYTVVGTIFPADSLKIVCIPAGNAYLPDSIKVPVDYQYDESHKKSTWYEGHATLTVNFNLSTNPGK